MRSRYIIELPDGEVLDVVFAQRLAVGDRLSHRGLWEVTRVSHVWEPDRMTPVTDRVRLEQVVDVEMRLQHEQGGTAWAALLIEG